VVTVAAVEAERPDWAMPAAKPVRATAATGALMSLFRQTTTGLRAAAAFRRPGGAVTRGRSIAAAAAEEADRLEAAYQQASSAIETLLTAIERVQELRGHQPHWEQAFEFGVAPKRPEPWQVRASHDDQLRQLNKRLKDALNSSW
jgi:hypothetical protein